MTFAANIKQKNQSAFQPENGLSVQQALKHLWQYSPGMVLCVLIAVAAMEIGKLEILASNGIGALSLSIIFGMLVGNTIYPRFASKAGDGVNLSKQKILRLGIILYGLRLSFQDIAQVGVSGILIDMLVLSSTFLLAYLLGTKVFGLDEKTAMLIGAGSSICGAAAVMAAEPVIKGRAEQVTVAVSTVVVFGSVAIFLYPALYHLSAQLPFLNLGSRAYGIFTGSTVHEVAQVIAAAHAVSEDATNTAVITKMVRVMMLAPFLIILSTYLSRRQPSFKALHEQGVDVLGAQTEQPEETKQMPGKIVIPWFALIFVLVAGLNSLVSLPHAYTRFAIDIDTLLLATAMAALGLTTHVSAIRQAGIKPLLLGATLFAWLMLGGMVINLAVAYLLA